LASPLKVFPIPEKHQDGDQGFKVWVLGNIPDPDFSKHLTISSSKLSLHGCHSCEKFSYE
jgi:hypothetical protein